MEPDKGKTLTAAEARLVEELRSHGLNVELVPPGANRTPDFRINGAPVELKTVSSVASQTSDDLSSAIASRILDARGQAHIILVDARSQPGMTRDTAQRGVNRAIGADNQTGRKIQAVLVLTAEGTVSFRR